MSAVEPTGTPGGCPQVRVDSHAHVFKQDLPVAPGSRHAPRYDALPDAYIALMERHGVARAMLTAPSFLGTDNSYLLDVLDTHKGRFRGTVIVDAAAIDLAQLRRMASIGAVGVRFNLYRFNPLPDFGSEPFPKLFRQLRDLDWHVEIYVEGNRLASVLPAVLVSGVRVVIDHFGSPDPALGVRCPGFELTQRALSTGKAWVKLSAPYRVGQKNGPLYAAALLRAGGPERLLWGSDWPWTQNEAGRTYQECLDWLTDWVPDPNARNKILGETAIELFKF